VKKAPGASHRLNDQIGCSMQTMHLQIAMQLLNCPDQTIQASFLILIELHTVAPISLSAL
jgi:hypothetical protein